MLCKKQLTKKLLQGYLKGFLTDGTNERHLQTCIHLGRVNLNQIALKSRGAEVTSSQEPTQFAEFIILQIDIPTIWRKHSRLYVHMKLHVHDHHTHTWAFKGVTFENPPWCIHSFQVQRCTLDAHGYTGTWIEGIKTHPCKCCIHGRFI